MWTRCFPSIKKLREILASDEIGPVVYIQGDFGYSMVNIPLNDRHWMPSSGGITLDVAMYIASFGRLAFPNGKVKQVHATGNMKNGVDYSVMASMTYQRSESESKSMNQDGMMQFILTGAANTEERMLIQVIILRNFCVHFGASLSLFFDLLMCKKCVQVILLTNPNPTYPGYQRESRYRGPISHSTKITCRL